ncbi:MAG: LacI family transcriptional regulator, partial [Microbacterium sp.]
GAVFSPRRSVEFLVDKLTSPYAMEILRGATVAAEESDIDVVVGRFRRPDAASDADVIERLAQADRMGAIIVTAEVSDTTYAALTASGTPVVFVDPLRVDDEPVVSVGSTNWIGGRSATEYLIGLGHTRLAMVGGPATSFSAMARIDGFRSAAQAASLTIHPDFIAHARFDHDEAQAVAARWLLRDDRPTAILASSDAQALGVLEAARLAGISVPDQLSVVGYDDTYVAAWAHPPLTSVFQPLQDIGRVCIRTLERIADGVPLDSHHIELATRLVVRESTAPPPR